MSPGISDVTVLFHNALNMSKSHMVQRVVCIVAVLFLMAASMFGDIRISPHYIFVSSTSNRLISLSVTNTGTDEREVWVDSRYGYETSDDSGKIYIKSDTTSTDVMSSATWISCYPKRFILKSGEGQTIRFMVNPPADLSVGEYWSRIYVSSKTRQVPKPAGTSTNIKPGIALLIEQSIPFHFRVGTVKTGVQIDSVGTALTDTGLVISSKLFRTGNAAFWGSRTILLNDQSGKNWITWTHNTGVYKDITLVDKFNRVSIPSGEYTLVYRLHSDGRTDVPPKDLLKIAPVEISVPVHIP
jgi:hypothetical protein